MDESSREKIKNVLGQVKGNLRGTGEALHKARALEHEAELKEFVKETCGFYNPETDK